MELTMKKIASSVLALALVATGAFAADAAATAPAPTLKFSGYLNTGIDGNFTSDKSSVTEYAHDEGTYGTSLKLIGTYDAENYGFKFRLRSDSIESQISPLVNYAYGWYKPVAGLTVLAGKLNEGSVSALDDEGDNAFAYLMGAEALYTVNGFSVAAAAGNTVKSGSSQTASGLLSAYAVKYSLPKAFSVEGHLTVGYDQWGGLVSTSDKIGGYAVTASIDAIQNLSLYGGYNVYNVSADAYTFFDVGAYYTLDALTFGGLVYDHISAKYWEITPSVAYAVNTNLTLGAKVQILTDDKLADTYWNANSEVTPVGATEVPYLTAAYSLGGSKTTAAVGYDVANKVAKTYLDFVFSF